MQVSGLRTSIVNVSNNGFGGSALGMEMANAVKILSSRDDMRTSDNADIASAIDSMSPSMTASVNEAQDQGLNSPSTPSSGKGDVDRGI